MGGRSMADVGFGLLKFPCGTVGELLAGDNCFKPGIHPKIQRSGCPPPPCPEIKGHQGHRDHPIMPRAAIRRRRRSYLGRDNPRNPESRSREQSGALQREGQEQHRRFQLGAGGVPGLGEQPPVHLVNT